jgi:ankyrin repeat protein
VLLSQERGSRVAAPALNLVLAADVPVVASREVHPDAIRKGGATALMAAAYVGALELARDLIERGADLAVQDEEGFSALMYAANGGQDELVGLGLGLALR